MHVHTHTQRETHLNTLSSIRNSVHTHTHTYTHKHTYSTTCHSLWRMQFHQLSLVALLRGGPGYQNPYQRMKADDRRRWRMDTQVSSVSVISPYTDLFVDTNAQAHVRTHTSNPVTTYPFTRGNRKRTCAFCNHNITHDAHGNTQKHRPSTVSD